MNILVVAADTMSPYAAAASRLVAAARPAVVTVVDPFAAARLALESDPDAVVYTHSGSWMHGMNVAPRLKLLPERARANVVSLALCGPDSSADWSMTPASVSRVDVPLAAATADESSAEFTAAAAALAAVLPQPAPASTAPVSGRASAARPASNRRRTVVVVVAGLLVLRAIRRRRRR